MAGSSFGRALRLTTFGESHGPAIGGILDGCPPGMALTEADLQPDMDRRRPGRGRLMSTRNEGDQVRLLSGISDGLTTGTAIGMLITNEDARPKAYDHMQRLFRPSHADFTYQAKYGHRARSGGGRASARETAMRVAAGAIAKKILQEALGVEILAWVDHVADIDAQIPPDAVTMEAIQAHPTQCPDPVAAAAMQSAIEAARKDGDTLGGTIRCIARGVPAGLGDPVFEKLDARLAMAMLSIPACKGISFGSGFDGTRMRGTEHNDPFIMVDGAVRTRTNHSGGIQGGISNGMPIDLRCAFKPVATHFHPQETVTEGGEAQIFRAKGRHDPCVLPRATVIVEAMAALVLADAWLVHRGQNSAHIEGGG